MREEITLSTKRTGELTEQRDDAVSKLAELRVEYTKVKKESELTLKTLAEHSRLKSELKEEMAARKKAEDNAADAREDIFSINREMQYYKGLLEEHKISVFPSMTDDLKIDGAIHIGETSFGLKDVKTR